MAVAVAGLAGGGMALAGAAGATQTSGTTVSLQSSSDGAVAQWTGTNEATLKLTVGSQSGTTFAEMSVNGVSGQPAPATPPSFTTSGYGAGSPRWVIELSNGCNLAGYPEQLGGGATAGFTGNQWELSGSCSGTTGEYETYQDAYFDAGAENAQVTVTAAFIVADGDQTAATTDTLTNVMYNQNLTGSIDVAPSGPVCYDHSTADPAAACAWQQLGQPSGYVLDVKGQVAKSGTPIIAWQGQSGDPAEDLSVVPSSNYSSTNTGTYRLVYTPYGNYTDALQHSTSVADSAYSTGGTPLYCVSGVADSAGQAVQLRGCATGPNQWQDLNAVQALTGSSHRLWEPSYAVSNHNPMALNDKGYGKDGSPIINWAPYGSSWNEEFYPANAAAAG